MNRRALISVLPAIGFVKWQKPIINSIVLPAHAMTSCSLQDIAGDWVLEFTNSVVEIRLYPPQDEALMGGEGIRLDDGFPIFWIFNMDLLTIEIASNTYEGIINDDCSTVTGTDTNNSAPFTATRS